MTARCSDCDRLVSDLAMEGVCAERGGHEARCTCRAVYRSGLVFPGPTGFAGYAVSPDCPLHAPRPSDA